MLLQLMIAASSSALLLRWIQLLCTLVGWCSGGATGRFQLVTIWYVKLKLCLQRSQLQHLTAACSYTSTNVALRTAVTEAGSWQAGLACYVKSSAAPVAAPYLVINSCPDTAVTCDTVTALPYNLILLLAASEVLATLQTDNRQISCAAVVLCEPLFSAAAIAHDRQVHAECIHSTYSGRTRGQLKTIGMKW
jgi:hypothetical protein